MTTDRPVAIVTAASRGIGAGCARALAEEGFRVALLARSPETHRVAKELGGLGVTGSVTDEKDLKRLVETAEARYGRIDVVVNNTGHPAKGDLLAIPEQSWAEGYELLLQPVLRLARLVTPLLERQGGGSIVNLSSLWAVEPSLDAPISSTFRAALSAFTKLYADRYAKAGIRMNCILAGFADSHEVPDPIRQRIPVGRAATPREIGRLVVYLASPDSAYLTGQSIRIDGGLTRSL
jgi:NAD(P)-dependent dehydrogenase (short-subunit alcohol dehydrogenase family)